MHSWIASFLVLATKFRVNISRGGSDVLCSLYMNFGDLLFLVLLLPGLIIIALIVFLVFPRALRDEKRLANNRCMECGYDLRQSPDRCPECGRPANLPDPPSAGESERH